MAVPSMKRADLARAVQHEIGLSLAASELLVEQILGHMCSALSQGEDVKIRDFGTFLLRDKPERVGRNPRTLETYPITARRVPSFRASGTMRQRVAAPLAAAVPPDSHSLAPLPLHARPPA